MRHNPAKLSLPKISHQKDEKSLLISRVDSQRILKMLFCEPEENALAIAKRHATENGVK